ncbi:lytic transglycosylase domain-containing protein [Neiella marina]|uniref:Lytic transglycosylase domain-containing protein n=1 Tax=Neiella holothuriorum TaxID=2870530 RepID=A0ABS7EG56_9GAMM|nr:lytic transglycosylase domain-containing protein [Neiella holothuriorum]MBW8191331.1 lytic transglycosylase domain-containing protein [Neiella holothuriorum]
MFELPPVDLVELEPNPIVIESCLSKSAKKHQVPEVMLRAIMDVEAGKVGTVKANRNGSADLGVMQINTINLNEIKTNFPDVGWYELATRPCTNIDVAAWFLKKKIDNRDGHVIEGVGDYHSKTPEVRIKYMFRIFEKLNSETYQSLNVNWSEILGPAGK